MTIQWRARELTLPAPRVPTLDERRYRPAIWASLLHAFTDTLPLFCVTTLCDVLLADFKSNGGVRSHSWLHNLGQPRFIPGAGVYGRAEYQVALARAELLRNTPREHYHSVCEICWTRAQE